MDIQAVHTYVFFKNPFVDIFRRFLKSIELPLWPWQIPLAWPHQSTRWTEFKRGQVRTFQITYREVHQVVHYLLLTSKQKFRHSISSSY